MIRNNGSLFILVDLLRRRALRSVHTSQPLPRLCLRGITRDLGTAASWDYGLVLTETLVVDQNQRAENELLSTSASCVDPGISSNLLSARTKPAQKHFSVCPL